MIEPPIKGFIPNTLIDWEGRLSAEIFLSGCNFRCPFCHSAHLVEGNSLERIPLASVLERLNAESKWIDGVVISGGEPTLYPEIDELCRVFKRNDFLVKIDTNGTRPDVLRRLTEAGLIDFVSMDVKAPLDERYDVATGVKGAPIDSIKDSIAFLKGSLIEHEFRTTVVPTLHDWEALKGIGEALAGGDDWVLQQFRPKDCLDPDYERVKPYDMSFLKSVAERLCLYLPTRVRGEFD